MRLIKILCVLLLLPGVTWATVLLSDHFDMASDTDITAASQVTSESAGKWDYFMVDNEVTASVVSAAGHSGRGFRFTWNYDSDNNTQEGDLYVDEGDYPVSYPNSVWVGFWFRPSIHNVGSEWADILKMLRFRMGAATFIPEYFISTGQWNMYADGDNGDGGGNHYVSLDNACVDDSDWHYYIIRARPSSTDSASDGIIEFYIDGSDEAHRVYNNTAVHWGGTGSTIGFTVMQGNLSGSWCGTVFNTDWDDFILATTLSEVTDFLGATEEPALQPTMQGCSLQGGGN